MDTHSDVYQLIVLMESVDLDVGRSTSLSLQRYRKAFYLVPRYAESDMVTSKMSRNTHNLDGAHAEDLQREKR